MKLSQNDRDTCAHAIDWNIGRWTITDHSLIEMARVARIPYDPQNKTYHGDTLDRHSWSPYGNSGETSGIVALSLINEWAFSEFEIARTIQLQAEDKIDILNAIRNRTYQSKPVDYGSAFDGNDNLLDRHVFVSHEDLMGTADCVLMVCAQTRRLIIIDKQQMFQTCCPSPRKDGDRFSMEPHRYRESRIKQGYKESQCVGHYISPKQLLEFGRVCAIPDDVACVWWDSSAQQINITYGR